MADMAQPTVTIMTIDPALLLQNWLSPSFPVGAFAYSHGLEYAVHAGIIHDQLSCCEWITDLIRHGSWRNDAVIAGVSWQAATDRDTAFLVAIIELALALAPSRERHLESAQQGNAFLAAVRQSWPHPAIAMIAEIDAAEMPYAVAIGICSALHGIGRNAMTASYGLSFAQALVSAAMRLSVIGHTDGQKVLAALLPAISEQAHLLAAASLDDLGSATILSDLASLQHETQFTRFFRS